MGEIVGKEPETKPGAEQQQKTRQRPNSRGNNEKRETDQDSDSAQ